MTSQSGGGGAPTGAAGGVLGGNFPAPTFAGGGSVPILPTASAALAADLVMTNASQLYDGPSLLLAAGAWIVVASITLIATVGSATWGIKVWDGGSSVLASGEPACAGGFTDTWSAGGVITLAVPTTIKASALANAIGTKMLAASTLGSTGLTSSGIFAFRVA